MKGTTAVVLLNLGTPERPEPDAVGAYLREFLMDRWVVDIPALFRWILVHGLIVPKRKHTSAEAYKTVWTERGSPLLFHTQDLAAGVRATLGEAWHVTVAMRYGQPSIRSVFEQLAAQKPDQIIVFPLYPQYAESTFRSSEEECERWARKFGLQAPLQFVEPFYDDPGFLQASAVVASDFVTESRPDHILFSFHGLPERHIRKTDPSGQHCLASKDCCAAIIDVNRKCYRAQCYATAHRIADRLGLEKSRYSVSFQSRLGRTPWIRPYTDERYAELAKQGVRRLAVLCPSFVSDCLETIEEIGLRGREDFIAAGGTDLIRIPCVNSHPAWVKSAAELIRMTAARSPGRM